MTDYYKGYRIASARKPDHDYGQDGAYFITICTAQRRHFFGHIPVRPVAADQVLHPTPAGELAAHHWHTIPDHFPHIALGPFVVMPNHVHGILVIQNGDHRSNGQNATADTPQNPTANPHHRPEWKPGSIGVIVNQYKRIVTLHARKTQADFAWQARFHDHIIRDAAAYDRIADYILNNPAKWHSDRFYDGK